jgi:hypothetical protein
LEPGAFKAMGPVDSNVYSPPPWRASPRRTQRTRVRFPLLPLRLLPLQRSRCCSAAAAAAAAASRWCCSASRLIYYHYSVPLPLLRVVASATPHPPSRTRAGRASSWAPSRSRRPPPSHPSRSSRFRSPSRSRRRRPSPSAGTPPRPTTTPPPGHSRSTPSCSALSRLSRAVFFHCQPQNAKASPSGAYGVAPLRGTRNARATSFPLSLFRFAVPRLRTRGRARY